MDINQIASIFTQTLIYSTPLILTALGGVFSERSGIVNVGLEGIMVVGAFTAIVFNLNYASSFGSWTPWLGILVGGLAGVVFALLHAVATINFRADHIISGTVMNMLAPPLMVFLVKVMFDGRGQTDIISRRLSYTSIPVLSDIPVIGRIMFKNTFLPAYCGILIAIFAWFVIFKTKFGLRLRSVGEPVSYTHLTLPTILFGNQRLCYALLRGLDFRILRRHGWSGLCPIHYRSVLHYHHCRPRVYLDGSDDFW